MGIRQMPSPGLGGAEGLSQLLEAEARLEALVAVREAEAAALVAGAHRAVADRQAQLAKELDAMVVSHRRTLDESTRVQLDNIDRHADTRLAMLRSIPAAHRARVVQGIVSAVLEELVGKGPA